MKKIFLTTLFSAFLMATSFSQVVTEQMKHSNLIRKGNYIYVYGINENTELVIVKYDSTLKEIKRCSHKLEKKFKGIYSRPYTSFYEFIFDGTTNGTPFKRINENLDETESGIYTWMQWADIRYHCNKKIAIKPSSTEDSISNANSPDTVLISPLKDSQVADFYHDPVSKNYLVFGKIKPIEGKKSNFNQPVSLFDNTGQTLKTKSFNLFEFHSLTLHYCDFSKMELSVITFIKTNSSGYLVLCGRSMEFQTPSQTSHSFSGGEVKIGGQKVWRTFGYDLIIIDKDLNLIQDDFIYDDWANLSLDLIEFRKDRTDGNLLFLFCEKGIRMGVTKFGDKYFIYKSNGNTLNTFNEVPGISSEDFATTFIKDMRSLYRFTPEKNSFKLQIIKI